jgi:hypothetical protein
MENYFDDFYKTISGKTLNKKKDEALNASSFLA